MFQKMETIMVRLSLFSFGILIKDNVLDAIKARQNVRFVTFYQKKFSCSSKEAYYYGEKSSVLAYIFTSAHLEYFEKNLLFAPFL